MDTPTTERHSAMESALRVRHAIGSVPSSTVGVPEVIPLSTEQYHRMLETGVVPEGEPIELLDGLMVWKDRSARGDDPMTVGKPHAVAMGKLSRIGPRLDAFGCCMRTQLPITLPPSGEPEPDAAIVSGTVEQYTDHHPGPGEVLSVVEVSDHSLERDRSTKQRIYADAGIPQYVIVNIPDRQLEVHERPLRGQGRYGHVLVLKPGENLALLLNDRRLEIPASSLLP